MKARSGDLLGQFVGSVTPVVIVSGDAPDFRYSA